MPTKEQLEETNDQLLGEIQGLRRRLDEAGAGTGRMQQLEAENAKLREDLERSEKEQRHVAHMLTSLTEAQSGMDQLYRVKEDTALQRLEIESAKVEGRRKELEKWREGVVKWQAGIEKEKGELESKLRLAERQAREAQETVQKRDEQIGRMSAEAQQLKARVAELEEKPAWIRGAEWVAVRPGLWLGVIGIVMAFWTSGYILDRVRDWMWP